MIAIDTIFTIALCILLFDRIISIIVEIYFMISKKDITRKPSSLQIISKLITGYIIFEFIQTASREALIHFSVWYGLWTIITVVLIFMAGSLLAVVGFLEIKGE